MPAIYHEGSWLGNATDPEVLVKDTVGWTGKNRAYSQTNNAVIAHIENGITYDVSWTGSATVTLKKNSASGATITSGSTSPLSFTADAEYELYFGSSATVTNIMVKDSRITDPTYEPYHESVEEEIEQIYADNGVLGAKNLLKNVATSGTSNGITYTVNSDKSISFVGTTTATSTFAITPDIATNKFLDDGNYILSVGTALPTGIELWLNGYVNGAYYNRVATMTAGMKEVAFTVTPNLTGLKLYIQIPHVSGGRVVSSTTIYPMIRLASDPDDTYQPYAMTNRELTEKVSDLDTNMQNLTTAESIPANSDLNTYYEAGEYNADKSSIVRSLLNKPSDLFSAFQMRVIARNYRNKGGNTRNNVSQIIECTNQQVPVIYMRQKPYDENWGSWYKFTGTVVS